MKLSSFLKDKWGFLLTQGLLIGFVILLLTAYHVDLLAAIFVGAIFAFIAAVSLAVEYVKKNQYYRHLTNTLEQMDQKQYIASVLDVPTFAEAQLWCDVLRQTTKAMNDEIAKYQLENEEYRDYVEVWIHEVKTPISCTSLMCENNPDEQMRDVQEEISKIEYLVEQALYYARSTAVEKDYSIRTIELSKMVKSVVRKYSKPLISAHCAIKLDELEYCVYSDEKWLTFILGQVITNSIKYRREPFALQFSAKETEKSITLAIADNGIGIPESDIGRIFEKGFTGVNGRKFGKSTGIGLYLCKRLCEKMHLGISAQSTPSEGTTILITFPKDKTMMFE